MVLLGDYLINIIKRRRSIRKYKKDKVDNKLLLELIEAGIWAPSGSNIQPWYFILITKQNIINKIKFFSPGLLGNPPNLIILCIDKELAYKKGGALGRDILCLMDISMAAQNIMLMATEKELATCPVKSFNKKAIEKILEVPSTVDVELIISIGYPEKLPSPPVRKAKEKISFFNIWQGG